MKMEKVLRSALLLLLAAALCLSMAACTQTPAESSPVSETQTPETAASEKASTEDDMPEDAGTGETPASDALSSALPVKTLRAKRVDENPYMAKSDANIHHDGFGCSPHAIGRSVRCTCLSDGEMTRWNRDEFVGVLDEKFLPDWAKESLSQFQQEEAAESPGMNNQSM
jgi:ABC-type transport system substrate-binding protein